MTSEPPDGSVNYYHSLALFEKVLQSKQPIAGAAERAFDAALLIAIRERELSS
jgi:hypothetical protein